ncbi:MAG: hypothetical protein FJ104_13330 [Deltaproteobacteria bacterium]|nr:hypothetical protein [Deltaproteobacteria bacterium]
MAFECDTPGARSKNACGQPCTCEEVSALGLMWNCRAPLNGERCDAEETPCCRYRGEPGEWAASDPRLAHGFTACSCTRLKAGLVDGKDVYTDETVWLCSPSAGDVCPVEMPRVGKACGDMPAYFTCAYATKVDKGYQNAGCSCVPGADGALTWACDLYAIVPVDPRAN